MVAMAFQSATELAKRVRNKEISARELLDYYLDRVARFNPDLNAIIVECFDTAREQADACDRALAAGEVTGPLHGVPMTIKESYDLAGTRSTWGNPAMKENIASSDSVLVSRLKAAGANIFGKTNVPLNLADFQSFNEIYGTTNNPWDTGRTPGGSSGGSAAALAAGMTGLETGSDIGGSIRNPAHYCGVYGLKPTWGVVPIRGHGLPDVQSPADISVVGPLARSAEDLALSLDVTAGGDWMQSPGWQLNLPRPQQKSLADYRIAVWQDDEVCPVDSEISDAVATVAAACSKAGARIDDQARPDFDMAAAFSLYRQLLWGVMAARQPMEIFESNLKKAQSLASDDQSESAVQIRAAVQYHRDWLARNEMRTKLRRSWKAFFADYDVLLCPIAAVPAFPHDHSTEMGARILQVNGQETPYFDQLFWAGITGVAYLPSTVAPVCRSKDGLPIGVQIVGPEYGDYTTIDVARLLAEEIGGFVPPPGYDE